MKTVTLTQKEYKILKLKEKIADDAVVRLKLSIDDLKHGRIKRVA